MINQKSTNRRCSAKTGDLISRVRLVAVRGSDDFFELRIEAYKTEDIPAILAEFIDYLHRLPPLARAYDQARIILSKRQEEITANISSSKELLNQYEALLRQQKLIPIGFNPIELYRGVSNLEIEKVQIEQAIKNLKLVEVIEQFVSAAPVRPNLLKNAVIAAILGLMLGIFIAFLIEWKIRATNKR